MDYKYLLSGVDSLYLTISADVKNSEIDFPDLVARKEDLRQSDKNGLKRLRLGTETLYLQAYGGYPYTYILSNRDFEIKLSENLQPAFYVKFASKALWANGWKALHERFDAWLRSIDAFRLRPDGVARCDWAFDFLVPEPNFNWDHFTSRASKDVAYRENRKLQTFTFGRGDVVVRVYDKSAEIRESSHKYWFYDLWGVKLNVWRIEFQVRGERLKGAGIRTINHLPSLQSDLLRELASKHTRLRQPNDDANRSRWPTHPLWNALLAEIAQMPQAGLVQEIPQKNDIEFRLRRQAQMIVGQLKGFAAIDCIVRDEQEPPNLPDFLARLQTLLEPHCFPFEWKADVEYRLEAYEAGKW